MKRFRLFSVFFLLPLFLFAAFPTSLIHEFFHDHESTDVLCTRGDVHQVGVQHQHCELLQLNHPPLEYTFNEFSDCPSSITFVILVGRSAPQAFSFSPILFFRGPPEQV